MTDSLSQSELRMLRKTGEKHKHEYRMTNCHSLGKSSVFGSVEHIRVININTNQSAVGGERDMWDCCHVVEQKARELLNVCLERKRVTGKE